jgi:linoleoyl-CoA desaturase
MRSRQVTRSSWRPEAQSGRRRRVSTVSPHSKRHVARVEAYRDWSVIALGNHLLLGMIALLRPSGTMAVMIGEALGLGVAMGGVVVLHNAAHRRYSRSYFINMLIVQSAVPVGLWLSHWALKHSVHHRIPAAYPDDSFTQANGYLRLHPNAPCHSWHRFQHQYAWLLYALAWPVDLISQLRYLFSGEVSGLNATPGPTRRIGTFLLEKATSGFIVCGYIAIGGRAFILPLCVAIASGGFLAATIVAIGFE